jgi:hypothetical protein
MIEGCYCGICDPDPVGWPESLDGEQLELFPELVAQWEEDAKWYTILRQRVENDL